MGSDWKTLSRSDQANFERQVKKQPRDSTNPKTDLSVAKYRVFYTRQKEKSNYRVCIVDATVDVRVVSLD